MVSLNVGFGRAYGDEENGRRIEMKCALDGFYFAGRNGIKVLM
jgi:hypothetical protein